VATREEKLQQQISEKFKSTRDFCRTVDIPESTLRGVFRHGISSTGVDTVIKICDELKLNIRTFDPEYYHNELLPEENEIIHNYRKLSDDVKYFLMKSIIDMGRST
jgi:hypothetical protein